MKKIIPILGLYFIFFSACKKDMNNLQIPTDNSQEVKTLNQKEKETVAKFEHASLVLQGLFSTMPDIRKEFNGFIAAKLAKSGTDEELTFREIFEASQVNLNGVRPDFLVRFRDAFVTIFINRNYPLSSKYSGIKFNTVDDVSNYFGVKSQPSNAVNSSFNLPRISADDVPYEIYFPYSENWNIQEEVKYAVTFHPLTNLEWNYGMFYDQNGNPLYEVTIDDEFAYNNPTYIITYDDGLKVDDFINGQLPIKATTYKLNLTGHDYEPIIIQSQVDPNPSPCAKELRVKDGRWTLLRNGYGLFEGKIEYAVAVTKKVTEVSVPNQNPQSNPIILTDRTGHAFGYQPIRRKKVKQMQKDINDFISIGLNVSPWCAGQPDKMIFLYEYDRPNVFSENSLEWSNLLTAGAGLIGDDATRAAVSSLMSAGIAPLVKSLLEGTARSRIEHYSIIGSNAVWANQKIPTNGASPTLLNGYRPYGKNSVMATLVID